MLKRKQPVSSSKQRSIKEFFKTPAAQPALKRSKVQLAACKLIGESRLCSAS